MLLHTIRICTCREVLQAPPTLLAVTHTHLLLFAATTLELVDSIDLRGQSISVCVCVYVLSCKLVCVCKYQNQLWHFLDPLPSSNVVPSVTAVASLTFDPLSDNVS